MLKNRIEYGFILLAAVALFIFYHNFFFFYLLIIVAALPFISFFVSRHIWKKLVVSASVTTPMVEVKNEIPIEFTVYNRTFFPMPGVRIGFKAENRFYPNSEMQEINLPVRRDRHIFGWSINSVYAGQVRITGDSLSMQDYLGLYVFRRQWECEAFCSVMPQQSFVVMGAIEHTFTDGDEQETDSGPTTEDVTQIREFREYRPGDRLQRVNWKISSKHDELYVKEFEQEYNRTLTILVELRRDTDEIGFLDELITAFYSSALKLLEMEIHFYVQWYDIEHHRCCSELINEEDGLTDVLCQMYMMQSYDGCYAFEKYNESVHKPEDIAIYLTSPSFSAYDPEKKIGTYKERVILICL